MNNNVPIIKSAEHEFIEIPSSVRLAILLPTVRWTPMSQAIIGSLVGIATEEIAVLIADNSESAEKRAFLKKIRSINPHVIAITHKKNIGSLNNFRYLFNWCKNIEFTAIMADDDWMSPRFHSDAYQTMLHSPNASCASMGTVFVDQGDGQLVNVTQTSMCGDTPLERMRQWDARVARGSTYIASRRITLEAGLQFQWSTPLQGLTLLENLMELSRLAFGDFINVVGHGCFVHYPEHGSKLGDANQRFYNILCKEAGLQYDFIYFTALSTAIQCAVFLMGNLSPIADSEQKAICGQYIFSHIFTTCFLPIVSGESSHAAAAAVFVNHPEVMAGFSTYCSPPFSLQPVFDQALFDWFIEIIKVFESKPLPNELYLSERFRCFINSLEALPNSVKGI